MRDDRPTGSAQADTAPGAGGADATDFDRRVDARLVLSVVACGILAFGGVAVETAMNVTFPALMREFSVGTSTVQWITTAYLLVLSVVIPTFSFLSRRFPTRALFVATVLLTLLGILRGATAGSFSGVLLGRLLQGMGAGVSIPLMFGIISEQAPYRSMGTMMGIGSLVIALAPAIGPSIGGLVAERLGWRWVFWCLVPLVLASLALGVISIRQSHPTSRKVPFDLPGWLLLAACFVSLIVSVNRMGRGVAGVTSPLTWALLAASAALATTFAWRERRAGSPLVRLEVFRQRTFAFSALSQMLLQFVILGVGYLLPNYSQLVMGAGSAEAGSIMLPGCLLGAALAPASGRILDRLGPRRPIVAGAVILLAGVCLLNAFSAHLETRTAICLYMVVTLGQGLMVGNTMTNGLAHLDDELRPDGNAAINTLQQLSGALGTGVVTAIVSWAQQAGTADLAASTLAGSRVAYLVVALVAGALLASQLVATGARGSLAPVGGQAGGARR